MQTAFERSEIAGYSCLISGAVTHPQSRRTWFAIINMFSILSNSSRFSGILSKLLWYPRIFWYSFLFFRICLDFFRIWSDSLVFFRIFFVFFWNPLNSLEFTWILPDSRAFFQDILDPLIYFRILQISLGFPGIFLGFSRIFTYSLRVSRVL